MDKFRLAKATLEDYLYPTLTTPSQHRLEEDMIVAIEAIEKQIPLKVAYAVRSDGEYDKSLPYCYKCGNKVKDQLYCENCGQKLDYSGYQDTKDIMMAILEGK